MSYDYSKFEDGTTVDQITDITAAVDGYLDEQVKLAELEEAYKAQKRKVQRYEEHLIPEAMREAGVTEFTTASGYKVSIKSDVRASIPAAKKLEAFKWLEENGHGGIIKRTLQVAFSMGEDEKARDLADRLSDEEYSVGVDKRVESSSLRALVRREIADPTAQFPMDTFGASTFDKATVKSPKK